jgi:putative SOS response-associated peptidase YedK
MCGRVRLSSDVSEIKLVFSIPPHRPTPNIAPRRNVVPTDPLPVVRYDAKVGERSLDVTRWGLVPYWAKDIKVGFSNINAKAEGIEGKPAFREAFQRRRCLVPADNFYELARREVVCVIVRRRHPAGPAVPSAVPYEVGRIGNEPSKSPGTMYPAITTGTETARGRYFCQHQGG